MRTNVSRLWRFSLLIVVALFITGCLGGGTPDIISDDRPLTIRSVDLGVEQPVIVLLGTSAEQIMEEELPQTARVTLSNNLIEFVPVVWSAPDDFDPDELEEYVFEGVFEVAGLTGDVDVIVRLLNEIIISKPITENTTLSAEYKYKVINGIEIYADLTIEPGVQINFESNTYFDIKQNGAIIADGTNTEPIVLTGTEKERGWWQGVRLGSNSPKNSLTHVTIEYAGGGGLRYVRPANLMLGLDGTPGRVKMNNTTLRESANHGLYVYRDSSFSGGNNTYTSNKDKPIFIPAVALHYLDDESDYSGNDEDYVLVDTWLDVDSSGTKTWNALNVPYLFDGKLKVDKGELIIKPGAEFVFEQDGALGFEAGSKFEIGGVGSQTIFTGLVKERGYWAGLRIDSGAAENKMTGVVIEYAGGAKWGSGNIPTALGIAGGSAPSVQGRVQMDNSIIRESASYGMYLGQRSNYSGSGNEFTANAEAPVHVFPNKLHHLTDMSTYQGNEADYILVDNRTSGSEEVLTDSVDRVWDALDVPYRFVSSVDVRKGTVTIKPGAELEFNDDRKLNFSGEGKLTAIGTKEDPIIFTGTNKVRGAWRGIHIVTMADNQMKYVVIEYGGSNKIENGSHATNLAIGALAQSHNGRLDFRDSISRNSKGSGILINRGAVINNDWSSVNDFTDNQEGDSRELK